MGQPSTPDKVPDADRSTSEIYTNGRVSKTIDTREFEVKSSVKGV
jgi:hypothetical protein